MRLTTLCPFDTPRTTKEAVIWLLANRQVMTFRQMRRALNRIIGFRTNQALWKTLKSMREDGQVIKIGKGEYRLSPFWIRDLGVFCRIVEQNNRAIGRTLGIDEEVNMNG